MWTLAHAHGTLLSIVHIVFSLTLGSRRPPSLAWPRRASRCLFAATVLLPGGFFLAGIFVWDGDPGLGVVLVPVGALLLWMAVWLTARGVSAESGEAGGDDAG